MSLLLDTHALLWLIQDSDRLGARTRTALLAGPSTVSAITVWEIAIKRAAGRLRGPAVVPFLDDMGFTVLSFTADHAEEAGGLPMHHRDPFDRGLVAQARVEGLVLVTADRVMPSYDVALLDASR